MKMEQDTEFYIGWQAEAPPGFARTVRRFVICLCLLVPAVALLIVAFQSGFSGGTFEYGKTTTLEGTFSRSPVPFLTIEDGKDASGKPVLQKILLVGPGKSGFDAKESNRALQDGERIKATGFLIYHDGKTGFQVESVESQLFTNNDQSTASGQQLGVVTLRGEITDPKCLLGVMKPGQGKPHRDCAVRCIAGGIPPVLKVANAEGETEYYLLAGPNGEPANDRVLDYVGDGVQVCGNLALEGDWLVLYADFSTIQRIHKESLNPGTRCN